MFSMLNFYPKMMGYSGGGGGGGGSGGGGGAGGASGGGGGAAGGGGGAAVGTGVGGLKTNNLCGEGGRNALSGSVFFPRGATGYLQVGSAGDHNYLHNGTEDYSVEFWIFPTKSNDRQTVFSTGGNSDSTGFACRIMEDGASGGSNGTKVLCQFSRDADGNYLGFLGGTVDINSWSHIALQFTTSNKQLKIYVNGQLTNSSDLDGTANGTFGSGNFSSSNSTYAFTIGREPYGNTLYLDGAYVSNLRICRGHIIYSSNFTPPTSPLTAHFSNSTDKTTILCCQNSDNPLEENSVSISGESIPQTITGYGNYYGDTTTNLITNGDFATGDLTGWTTVQATTSVVSGSARIVPNSSVNGAIYQQFTTVVGKQYKARMRVTNTPSSNFARLHLGTGTDIDSTNKYLYSGGTAVQNVGEGTYSFVFTPTGTTTTLWLEVGGGTQVTTDFDDISVVGHDVGKAPKNVPPFGTDDGVTFGGAIAMNSSAYMCFPTGTTEERGRGRGLFNGGGGPINTIQFIQTQSLGNANDFGDLTSARDLMGSAASSVRALFAGAGTPGRSNTIDFVTISTTSNATDFGDLYIATFTPGALASDTRAVYGGGSAASPVGTSDNSIQFVTIASTGDTTDFGDLTVGRRHVGGFSSPTRGVYGAGASPGHTNVMDYITIASTGDATDFGDMTETKNDTAGCSNATRGIFIGGTSPGGRNTIEFITIATTGNGTDFGSLQQGAIRYGAGLSNSIRGVFGGGGAPGTSARNTIDFVTIATTGDAVDFGDLLTAVYYPSACSDSHGGLS